MEAELAGVNWLAVLVGATLGVGAGFLWFGPLFGKAWAAGSHGIVPPERLPVAAMGTLIAGSFLLATVIGVTATTDALITAIIAILAAAVLQLSAALFSQKSGAAAMIDASYVVAIGAIMIVVQGIL